VGWASDWASFTDLLSFHLPDQTWHYFKTDNVLGQASWEKIPIASGQPAFDPAIQSSADDFIQDRFGQGFVAWLCIHITPGYGPLYSPYWVDLNKGSLIEIKGAVNRILEDRRGRYWSLSPGGKHVAWIRFPSEASGETTPGTGEIWVASFQIEEWRARLKESLADPSHEWSEQELTKALEKLYPKTERRKDHPCEKIAAIESLYKQQAPAWCPDGQRVAVVQANSTGDRILIIHLPTKRVTVLTKRPDD
jgi:hypothetical protein